MKRHIATEKPFVGPLLQQPLQNQQNIQLDKNELPLIETQKFKDIEGSPFTTNKKIVDNISDSQSKKQKGIKLVPLTANHDQLSPNHFGEMMSPFSTQTEKKDTVMSFEDAVVSPKRKEQRVIKKMLSGEEIVQNPQNTNDEQDVEDSDLEDLEDEDSLIEERTFFRIEQKENDAQSKFQPIQIEQTNDDLEHEKKKEAETESFQKSVEKRGSLHTAFAPIAIPLIKSGTSLLSDMKFGWRPKMSDVAGAPIPLYYDFEPFEMPMNPYTGKQFEALYLGPRYKNSIALHKSLANKTREDGAQSYQFKEPPNMGLINSIIKQTHKPEAPRDFLGMNPNLQEETLCNELIFDSNFESGNLDMVIKRKDLEYDLFMRVDTNTKGHHQWFYFSVENPKSLKGQKVRFNVTNFTKNHSLYTQGMRICISRRSMSYTWTKGGEEIVYKNSHIMRNGTNKEGQQKQYYMLSFYYEFPQSDDKTYFSYCYPYTFSNLMNFLNAQKQLISQENGDYLKQKVLCQSLGGIDVPLLTISSRLNSDPEQFHTIKMQEFQESYSRISLPFYKEKKYVIICARVHPGESNSSYMMQGLIKALLGNSIQAKELRKRCIFKIIPMSNPDGVIVGNYRTNIAGNDLNRKYHNPDKKLHPTVCAIKKLVSSIVYPNGEDEAPENDKIYAFIDMHGHSRKKNVFIYGPYYPLHHDRYLRMRIIPKLLSEETTKFRFFSCKFRIERSKEKAARIVLWREYDIMNCFTFEASFHGYLNENRQTEEFTPDMLERMGEHLVNSLYEYFLILEEEDRQKKLKELSKKKKKKQSQLDASQISQQQQMSQTASENFGKRKKSILTSNSSINPSTHNKVSEQVNQLVRQMSKKVNPRVHLGNIQEELDEDDIKKLDNDNMNPNEPNDVSPRIISQQQREESKALSLSLEGPLNGSFKRNTGGIRSIKQMLSILKAEEKKKHQMIDEEDDDSSDDNTGANSPTKSGKDQDSGSDSDPLEGELNPEQQAILHANIKGTIDQFRNYYVGDKKSSIDGKKLKKLKSNKDTSQRNNKSPMPQQQTPQRDIIVQPSLKKPQAKQDPEIVLNNPPPVANQVKHKRSLPQMQEESKSVKDSSFARPKVQAMIAHTNIELFAKHTSKTQFAPIQQVAGFQQYQTVKQTSSFGITQNPQGSKDQKQNPSQQRFQFQNPLIINKIGIDQMGNHEYNNHIAHRASLLATQNNQRDQSNPHQKKAQQAGATQSKNFFLGDNPGAALALLQNINMVGGLQVAGSGMNQNQQQIPIGFVPPHQTYMNQQNGILPNYQNIEKQYKTAGIVGNAQSANNNNQQIYRVQQVYKSQRPQNPPIMSNGQVIQNPPSSHKNERDDQDQQKHMGKYQGQRQKSNNTPLYQSTNSTQSTNELQRAAITQYNNMSLQYPNLKQNHHSSQHNGSNNSALRQRKHSTQQDFSVNPSNNQGKGADQQQSNKQFSKSQRPKNQNIFQNSQIQQRFNGDESIVIAFNSNDINANQSQIKSLFGTINPVSNYATQLRTGIESESAPPAINQINSTRHQNNQVVFLQGTKLQNIPIQNSCINPKGKKSQTDVKQTFQQTAKFQVPPNEQESQVRQNFLMAQASTSQGQQIIEIISAPQSDTPYEDKQQNQASLSTSQIWKKNQQEQLLLQQFGQNNPYQRSPQILNASSQFQSSLGETSGMQSTRSIQKLKQQQIPVVWSQINQTKTNQNFAPVSPGKLSQLQQMHATPKNDRFLLAFAGNPSQNQPQLYSASVYHDLETQQQEIMNKALPSPSIPKKQFLTAISNINNRDSSLQHSTLDVSHSGNKRIENRVIMNGSQMLSGLHLEKVLQLSNSKEQMKNYRRPSKHFEELALPEPGGRKGRPSRTNQSFHMSKEQDSSFTMSSIGGGGGAGIKLQPINEFSTHNEFSKEPKHKKYQNIIDTLMQDQYPINVSVKEDNFHSKLTNSALKNFN